jgi:hypothetical protein
MAYSVPRIAWRLATYILVCPVVRISLGLGSAIFLYLNGSVMAEKLTAIGYAFIIQGVLCLLVALASVFVKTIPKTLCILIGISSAFLLLAACFRSGDQELRWLSATLEIGYAVPLAYYFIAMIICMLNCHAHRTMKTRELVAWIGILAALLMLSPLVLASRLAARHS